jgi:transposase
LTGQNGKPSATKVAREPDTRQLGHACLDLWRRDHGGYASAYAPELNPIENVWEYLRGNKLAITVFDDYDDIVDKTCDAWNFFEQNPKRIASITTRTWATVNN